MARRGIALKDMRKGELNILLYILVAAIRTTSVAHVLHLDDAVVDGNLVLEAQCICTVCDTES